MNLLPSLYLITDRKQAKNHCLREVIEQAMIVGIRLIQIREKDLPTRELFNLAKEMKEIVKKSGGKLLINDRIDIALALDLDGVHLPQNGFPIKEARKILPETMLLGVSTHSLQEAMEAESEGADFITLGPIYSTPSKIKYGPPIGLQVLQKAQLEIRIPIFAIGGIKPDNINDIKEAGCNRVAVISAIMASSDVYSATKHMLEALEKRI